MFYFPREKEVECGQPQESSSPLKSLENQLENWFLIRDHKSYTNFNQDYLRSLYIEKKKNSAK